MLCDKLKFQAAAVTLQFRPYGENATLSKPSFQAFNSLEAQHRQHTFRAKEVVLVKHMPRGKLSWYSHTQGSQNKQDLFGCIKYFKLATGKSNNETVVVLTREPSAHFNGKEFEVPAYKLSILSEDQKHEQNLAMINAFPHELMVEFDSRQRSRSSAPMSIIARGEPVPRAIVKVLNKLGQQVTCWTDASDGVGDRRKASKPLVVTQHIRRDDGPEDSHLEVKSYSAEYVDNGDQGHSFEFSQVNIKTK